MKPLVLIIALIFIAYLVWEAATIWYKAYKAAHPVIRVKGRPIQYRTKEE